MLIERVSMYTGIRREKDLPITPAQLQLYEEGGLAQFAFTDCTADEREFFLTGVTSEEWEEMFPSDEEDHILEEFDDVQPF